MSKRTEKVEKVLSEANMLTDANKKQQQKLYKTIKAAGGDIGMKVRASEKTKEDKMPNAIYMDNPWGSSRTIDTYAKFQVREGNETSEDNHIDEAVDLSPERKLNQVLKSIPSRTRELVNDEFEKLIMDYIDNDEIISAIKKFYSKVGGRYKDINSLIKDTKSLIKSEEEKLDEAVDTITEAGLPTKRGAKQFKKFVKKAKKGKKDIGDKTQTKKLANQISTGTITDGTIISAYESFLEKDLEDMYYWRDRDKIALNDDNWVKGTFDDFQRPMFKNLPSHKDRHPYDVLRSGKFIETKDGKVVGQIDTMRGNMITLDIIDENNEHQYVDFEVVKLIKKIKDCQLKIDSNTTSKNKKVDTPWGKITVKENE